MIICSLMDFSNAYGGVEHESFMIKPIVKIMGEDGSEK